MARRADRWERNRKRGERKRKRGLGERLCASMFQVRSDGLGLLLFAKEGMAGTLGATRFYACARHGARARHTRTHAAGRGRRLGIRSHRLPLRLLGFLPGRGSRAGAGRGGGSLGRGSAGSVAGARTGLGWWWLGGVPAAGSCVSELSPAALGPPRPVPAPASRARPFFPGRPGARRRSRGGGGPSPRWQPALAAPPGTPAQRRHCGCRADRAPGRFIYLFIFPFPFLPG